jgi:DNA-3-methyladenine glycosylase
MRLPLSFYERDVLDVAPEIIGKKIIRKTASNLSEYIITEAEAYHGIEDQASHARFGKTLRNSVMFESGGILYVYMIYGMYWMLNIVTGLSGQPQAILIRGVRGITGPGRVARMLLVDKTFNRENLCSSDQIWIEETNIKPEVIQKPRFGIDYAGEPWKSIPWRYIMVQPPQSF